MEIILWKNAKKRIFRVYSAKKAQTNGFIAFVEKKYIVLRKLNLFCLTK